VREPQEACGTQQLAPRSGSFRRPVMAFNQLWFESWLLAVRADFSRRVVYWVTTQRAGSRSPPTRLWGSTFSSSNSPACWRSFCLSWSVNGLPLPNPVREGWPTIHPKPCDLRVGSARAGPRRATRARDRSRGSCPRADNAAECQPDRARMLPSELSNRACAGAPQVQCRRGQGPVSGHRRGLFREEASGLQKVRLVSAGSSAIPEFLLLPCQSASSTFPQYRACDCNTRAAP